MVEHHIQRDIIDRLAHAKRLRFSELKPTELESNSFMYHLKQLITLGYVEQLQDKSYTLTADGLSYVDGLSSLDTKPRRQPKLIKIFFLKNDQGEVLLARRKRQPSIDTWMIPSGKQHFGESAEQHVARELAEQLGAAIEPRYAGTMDLRVWHSDQVVSHLSAAVYATIFNGDAPLENDKFTYVWARDLHDYQLTPGTSELIDAIEQGESFQLSLDVTSD